MRSSEFDAPPTDHGGTGGTRYSGTQELEPVH